MSGEEMASSRIEDCLRFPPDIAKSWIRGEYLIGALESTGYELIGWSLVLRGMYIYQVTGQIGGKGPVVTSHWGICTIDINEGDLTYQGVRLYTNPALLKQKGFKLSFWQSEFSKISRERGVKPHVYFGYVLFKGEKHESVINKRKDNTFKKVLNEIQKIQKTRKQPQEPISLIEDDMRNSLREYLAVDFQRDLISIQPDRENQIVSIIHVDFNNWTIDMYNNDQTRSGQYQPVDNDASKDIGAVRGNIYWYPL